MNQSGQKQSGELERRQQQQQQQQTSTITIRRHSRNRLVLIGRTPPGSTGANKTTDGQRRDGQGAGGAEQGAEQRRTMIDDRAASYGETDGSDTGLDDPELAQRHPSKLTHGFWMRRYSGLHGGTTTIEEQLRPSGSGLTATAGSRPQPVAGSSPVAVSGCRQPDRPRLLARWTNAWMLRGRRGSSCAGSASKLVHHQQAGGAAGGGVSSSPITGRSGASSAPPPASASSPAAGAACDNTGQGRPERTGGRCHRKHRTRQTSAAGGGHDGMTKAAGASASGASHSPFGCQFCGWRSGTHVARSSSYSSASSSTSSSSSSSDQQQHKKRPQAGSEGHESRPQQKDSNIERPLPRASSERPNQAKEEETTGRSLEFGSKSLLTDWLFRPATSSPVAANNSGSNSRMSPYRQVVHRLWGAHKQQQQDQAASTGVKILGDQQQQQQLDNQQRRRRLGSLLFTSPKKRSCSRVSDDHQPIKAKLHQSTTKAAAEAARGASSTDQENDDNESRGGGGGSSTKVADEDKTSRNAHEISIGADGSLMETTDPLGAEAMGGGGEWGNVAEKGNNFQLDRSPADFPNPSGRPSGSGSVSSSSWRPNESGEPDKQIQQQQLSRQMSVKDDNRLESRLLKQANGDNRFGRGGVDQTRISGLGESKDCSSGPTAHDVAKMDEESRHRADFQRAVTIDHEQNEGLVSSNNNSYREPDSEPLEFQQAKRLVSLAKAEFTSASPKAAATSGPNGPSETIAPDSLALGTPSSEASAFGTAGMAMQGISSSTSLLPLIQPLASSTSSLASSSICNLDSMLTTESTSQQHLAMAGKAAASTGQESSGGQAWSSMQQHELLQSYQPGDMVVVSLAADPTSPAWLDGDDNTEASSNNNNNTGPTNIKEQEEENKHLAHGGTGDVKVPLPRQPARQTTARPLSQPVSSSELMCRSGRIAGAQPPVLATSEPQQPQQPPAASTEVLKSNFKKLVKRQQSVDSYRMAREQKQKLKREQQERDHPGSGGVGPADGGGSGGRQHQSNEAIRICSIGVGELDRVASSGRTFSMRLTGKDEPNQGVSVVVGPGSGSSTGAQPRKGAINFGAAASGGEPASSMQKANFQVEICVDPYAQPGSFMLPGEQLGDANNDDDERNSEQEHHGGPAPLRADKQRNLKTSSKPKVSPTPPNTLSLMPAPVSGTGGSTCPSPASSLLMGSGFSGCITPTYPTHHLPSPKYVSPAAFAAMQKKHSNASTISSSLGIDSLTGGAMGSTTANQNGQMAGNDQSLLYESMSASAAAAVAAAASSPGQQIAGNHHQQQGILSSNQPSENGSSSFSLAASRRTSKSLGIGGRAGSDSNQQDGQVVASALTKEQAEAQARAEAEAAAAAQRRANLAEHIYDNKCGLGEDMKFLASLPEMCDITFLVGETREPVCAVKSVLAARSRVFHKILFGQRIEAAARAAVAAAEEAAAAQRHQANQESTAGQQHQDDGPSQTDADDHTRRASSPRQTGESGPLSVLASVSHLASKTSSRSNSPNQQAQQSNQQQQQQWSVIPDASGLSSRPATMARTDSTLASGGRSGRVSVASNGRESVSQASQGSQQPLIIGPGQTATPAPIKKGRKGRREDQLMGGGHSTGASAGGGHSRLSRMFLNKRASDPSIKHHQQQLQYQQQHGQATAGGALGAGTGLGTGDGSAASGYQGSRAANQSYLDKMSSSQRSTTVIIEEFEPDVFRQLIEYIHTGCVLLQARTLLGLLNAADYYGLEQLRRACLRFVSCCITVDTVCSLLSTAERYIQYKCTKSIVQKVLEFVDSHANDIFKLNAFGLLPEHVVRLILARDGLQADEQVKYEGVYTWCEHYCRSYELTNMSDVMQNFLDLIQFHKIPTNVLLTEIYPARIVPDEIFLSALAYQANPEVFEPQPSRQRRMTLPSSLMLGGRNTFGDERESHPDELISAKSKGAGARRQSNSPAATTRGHQHRRSILGLRKSAGSGEGSGAGGAANTAGDTGSTPSPAPNKPASSGRKGSLAQVSISGVKRFSHRLPLRKRHSNMPTSIVTIQSPTRSKPLSPQQGTPPPPAQQSPLDKSFSVALTETSDHTKQADSGRVGGSKRQLSLAQSNLTGPNDAATAAALAASAAAANSQDLSRDPIQLGRQILDAYLTAKRQQELEEEEEKERQREQAEAAKLNKTDASESFDCSSGAGGDQQQPSAEHSNRTGRLVSDPKSAMKRQPLVKTPSSSRKSFRDFKHISRRIFMRHSSSKSIQLQQQQSVLVGGVTTSSGGGGPLQQTKRVNSGDAGSGGGTRFSSIDKKLSADFQHNKGQQQQQETQTGRGRRLLRIKRSETVFEATTVNPESSSGHHGPSKLLHQLSANLKKS